MNKFLLAPTLALGSSLLLTGCEPSASDQLDSYTQMNHISDECYHAVAVAEKTTPADIELPSGCESMSVDEIAGLQKRLVARDKSLELSPLFYAQVAFGLGGIAIAAAALASPRR
jgi:hypothetical protein